MLTKRQSNILDIIIDEHIKTAMPISSGMVFDVGAFGVSCPTIRNDMAELTEEGYLFQPHTSAGRVPTQRAYRIFVDGLIKKSDIRRRKKSDSGKYRQIKSIAQDMAARSNEIAIFIDDYGQFKYIGLRETLRKPEFQTVEAMITLIEEVERLEKYIDEIFRELNNDIDVFIGGEIPFFESENYSLIASRFNSGFISLLGPTRMDYRYNLRLFEEL